MEGLAGLGMDILGAWTGYVHVLLSLIACWLTCAINLGWQYDMYAHTEEDKQRWFEQAPGKLKSTTFAANVLARTGSETCMWSFASQMIEEAVASYDTTIEKEVRDGKEVIIRGSDREMEGEWKMYIPPAVEWILVAGERLYEYSFCEAPEDSMKFNTRTPKAGDRIFSKDRWGFWKKRFRELIAWKEVDEHCRELMERALKKMDVLEAEEEQRLR